jgi:hypothetical protein
MDGGRSDCRKRFVEWMVGGKNKKQREEEKK